MLVHYTGRARVPPCASSITMIKPVALNRFQFPPVDEQLGVIKRGTAEIIVEAELHQKLERSRRSGRPLQIKLGLDPTAPDLHLGHTVVLRKLRDFQDLGHQVIVVIGDFTGMIGDPTGRSETRKPLTWDEIQANAETYRQQLGKVLDMTRVRIEFNSAWLRPLSMEDVIRLTAHITVAQLLQRSDFAARYESGRPISLHEFLYPVAQAFDSVTLGADVELGGTDQTFNLLVGRDLQRASGQEPQVALTVPLLEGLDGVQKMSKTFGNYVGINEPPENIYGKLMSVPDNLMWRYFELLTRIPDGEMSALKNAHPMDAKKRLAATITAQYGGDQAAREASTRFERIFQARQEPATIEEVPLSGRDIPLWRVLKEAGFVKSTSDGRRLIVQGAVEIDGKKVTDVNRPLGPGTYRLRVGKLKFGRVTIADQ